MSQKKITESSKNSMKPTNSWGTKKNLSATEICSIIKICGESGVASLSFGDLQVVFQAGPLAETKLEAMTPPPENPVSTDPPKSGSKELSEADRMTIEQRELDQMAIEDPAAYEKALIQKAEEDGGLPASIS